MPKLKEGGEGDGRLKKSLSLGGGSILGGLGPGGGGIPGRGGQLSFL